MRRSLQPIQRTYSSSLTLPVHPTTSPATTTTTSSSSSSLLQNQPNNTTTNVEITDIPPSPPLPRTTTSARSFYLQSLLASYRTKYSSTKRKMGFTTTNMSSSSSSQQQMGMAFLSTLGTMVFFLTMISYQQFGTSVLMVASSSSSTTAQRRELNLRHNVVPDDHLITVPAKGVVTRSLQQQAQQPPVGGSFQAATSKSKENSNVLVVISSDRVEGVIPVIGSILRSTTSQSVDIVMIGTTHNTNHYIKRHFGTKRVAHFTSLTIREIEYDLMSYAKITPIWLWPEWHTSITTENTNTNTTTNWFRPDTTIRVDTWDDRPVHAHELNHVRFYLPHLSMLQHADYLYFVDDDAIVQSDLGVMAAETLSTLPANKGFVTPCSMWTWRNECHTFEFTLEEETMLQSTPIYGNRPICETDTSTNCVPASYKDFIDKVVAPSETAARQQKAWNFGFSLFALQNWRDLQLTSRYEHVMRESYQNHIYPETSLAFGLGVPFLAFAGSVQCWDDTKVKVRDGFGFIDYTRLEETFGDDFVQQMDVIHYTGSAKPWSANSTISAVMLQPWLDAMKQEKLDIPPQLPSEPTKDLFLMIGSTHTDADRIMRVLDRHAQICAPGESDVAEIGFPPGMLDPDGISWLPTCSVPKGCTYAFVRDSILEITKDVTSSDGPPPRCQSAHDMVPGGHRLDRHLQQICNFVADLKGDYSDGAIARVYIDAYQKEDKRLLRCACKRGASVKGMHVQPDWLTYNGYPNDIIGPARLDLNTTQLSKAAKVIRIQRRDAWGRVKARLMDEATQIWNPQTLAEKAEQVAKLTEQPMVVDINDLKHRMESIRNADRGGDEWTRDYASEVLWVDYDNCRKDANHCLQEMGTFLGVDVADLVMTSDRHDDMFSPLELDDSLDYIQNHDAVRDLLREFDSASTITTAASAVTTAQ